MKINRFEDLEVWKEARGLRFLVSSFTKRSLVNRDFVFCNQIRSAALSIMSNIAEGFECASDKEFAQFLSFARRSCGEVRSQLYAALDDSYLDKEEFDNIYKKAILTGKLITGFITYLRNHKNNF